MLAKSNDKFQVSPFTALLSEMLKVKSENEYTGYDVAIISPFTNRSKGGGY